MHSKQPSDDEKVFHTEPDPHEWNEKGRIWEASISLRNQILFLVFFSFFLSSTFNPSSHRIHTSAPSPQPNLAIFEILIKTYTLNQHSYFSSPSTKREGRGYSPCEKLASGERIGVCYRQGKARKGKEGDWQTCSTRSKRNWISKKWEIPGKKGGGGGVIIECGSENQDYFTSSVLRMGTYFNTS